MLFHITWAHGCGILGTSRLVHMLLSSFSRHHKYPLTLVYLYLIFTNFTAAAEVTVHGCCSSLNETAPHHLGVTGSQPPDMITARSYRARIFSQTMQNEAVRKWLCQCIHNKPNSFHTSISIWKAAKLIVAGRYYNIVLKFWNFRSKHEFSFAISLDVMTDRLIGQSLLFLYLIGSTFSFQWFYS